MRQIITEDDIKEVIGRFIIQLDFEDEHVDITTSKNPNFWLEKRIVFVGQDHSGDITSSGLFYNRRTMSIPDFVAHFNSCNEGKRFHRFLTRKELDWLNNHLKNR